MKTVLFLSIIILVSAIAVEADLDFFPRILRGQRRVEKSKRNVDKGKPLQRRKRRRGLKGTRIYIGSEDISDAAWLFFEGLLPRPRSSSGSSSSSSSDDLLSEAPTECVCCPPLVSEAPGVFTLEPTSESRSKSMSKSKSKSMSKGKSNILTDEPTEETPDPTTLITTESTTSLISPDPTSDNDLVSSAPTDCICCPPESSSSSKSKGKSMSKSMSKSKGSRETFEPTEETDVERRRV